ncbi:hypothetical protein WJX77_001780 [Trebouxia sp. C0004]
MADSEDELQHSPERPAKRQKQFTFQRFAQRVAQVNVDVYRRLGDVRAEPLPGSSSFFQEQVAECRELNSTEQWLAVAAAVNPLAQSMPLLLHHQAQIMDILLGAIKLEAAISLPPILHVLSCLARDLQQDFLPYLPRVLTSLSDLVDSGADRHPELLSDLFTCLSNIFKHLNKHVAPQLNSVLRSSARLRYSEAAHVRQLAADAVGYLFRHVSQSGLKSGVQTLLAEQVLQPSPERVDGGGRLLAAAVKGIGNGLHSRAAALLQCLLREDLLTPSHFKTHQGSTHASVQTQQSLRANAAAVTSVALEHLLQHLRRGKTQVLWDCVLPEAHARIENCLGAGSSSAAAFSSAARAISHVAQCVEFFRGSRVEAYQPLFHLTSKLASPFLLTHAQTKPSACPATVSSREAHTASEAGSADALAADETAEAPEAVLMDEIEQFWAPSLSNEALRLLLALVSGHEQAIGASIGLVALQKEAQSWSPLFSLPPIKEVLPCICSLIRPPIGGPEVAQIFGPQLMAAVGRAILSGDALLEQLGMPLLVELCMALRPEGSAAQPSGLPVILTAQQNGVQLAAYINGLVSSWPSSPPSSSPEELAIASTAALASDTLTSGQTHGSSVAAAWVAVLCLPHANSNPRHVIKLLQALIKSTAAAVEHSCSSHTTVDARQLEEALFLQCYARGVLASVLELSIPQDLTQHLADTLQLLSQHPLNYHVIRCAAEVASVASKGRNKLPLQQLKEILPAVEPNLSHPSQAMRCATLRLLCCFQQPAMLQTGTAKPSSTAQSSQIFPMCFSIQSQTCTVDSGRQAAVTIGKMRTYLEYGQVPAEQVRPLVRCLVGILHIRFSLLWPPCIEALAAALDHSSQHSWPLILQQLTTAQSSFLSGAASGGGGDSRFPEAQGSGEVPQLSAELSKAMRGGEVEQSGGCTDAGMRLGNMLKAMAKALASSLEPKSRDWVPLFIAFATARVTPAQLQGSMPFETVAEPESTQAAKSKIIGSPIKRQQRQGRDGIHVGAKAWRNQLKEWLGFVGGIKGAKGVFRSQELKQCVVKQLQDTDSGVQQAALRSLQVFKVKFVSPYGEQLQRLAADQTLREAMTGFALGPGSESGIAPQHRAGLIPLLVRLLYPKMRKRSGRLGGKGAPGSARSAILNYLAALDPAELAPLVQLFLQPISKAFQRQDQGEESRPAAALSSSDRLFPVPWWGPHLGQHDGSWWLTTLDPAVLHSMPSRQRLGVLNAAHDLVKHLGHKLKPFLPEMCALVLVLLQGASLNSNQARTAVEGEAMSKEGSRNIRSSGLRFWAIVLQRFPQGMDYNQFWGPFLAAVEPQMERMAVEASSVRAPALLECVAAMAASPSLAPLLAGHPSLTQASDTSLAGEVSTASPDSPALGHRLMRSSLAVLSVPQCLDAARNATLNVVESLLDMEGVLGYNIIMCHVDQLLESLRIIVVTAWTAPANKPAKVAGQKRQGGKRQQQQNGGAPSRKVGTRCLAIMERLAGGIGDAKRGLLLADALMPLLQQAVSGRKPRNGTANETTVVRTLAVLSAVWQQLSAASVTLPATSQLERYVLLLSPLVGALTTPEARQGLAAAFVALSGLLPDLATPTRLLTGLNKRSENMIGEMDYDSSLAAYSELQTGFWMELKKTQGLPLMHQCFWDLRNPDDLALRHAAAQALSRCLAAASQQQQQGKSEEGSALGLVQQLMFNLAKKGMTAANLAVRQEHVILLRGLVVAFPGQYADLGLLLDKDTELDFFNNVAHLQLHRRQRALQRLTKVLNEAGSECEVQLSLSTLLDIVAPLLQQFILEGKAAEESGHDIKQIDKDREANVTDAAVTTLGALARQLPWIQYEQLLNQWLKVMKKSGTKAVIRGVCSIIDAFHFSISAQLPASADSSMPAESAASADHAAEEEEEGEHEATASQAAEAESAHRDIQSALTRRVLPSLRSQLVHDGEVVRAPVALAMVKLLKLLPEEAMTHQLPQALQGVAHLLRNRLQRIRDDARNVLVAMMAELGAEYLYFAIQVLHNACPAKGYTAHVLGYTLHAILDTVSKGAAPGALDGYLDRILPVMEADLFGDIADAKEADAFAAKYREAKKCKAYDMYQLLARMITFRQNIGQLLAAVRKHLPDASQPKVYNKLSVLLQHASRGIHANATASPQDLMIFIHGVLDGGLAGEEAAREAAQAEAIAAVHTSSQDALPEAEQTGQHDYMLVDFALGLLHTGLKKGNLGGQSPAALALLDPMLPLLVRAVGSRHANSVSLALKCLAFLIRLPLPGLAAESASAGKAVTGLLQRMSKTGDPIAQDCFKLLATLLRESHTYKPSNAQLRFLLTWAFGDMEEAANRQAGFGLLRAVLQRKLVVPEVYDIMTRVQEMMVRSQSAPIRQLCASVLLQFLLDYPVGDRRLQQHLHFIITNLSYEHETGREAAIEMLKIIISKFPEELVNDWCEVFFLPLVQRMTGDPSSKCREAVGASLKALMHRVAPDALDKLAQYCLIWLGGGDARLARTAAQALGILVQVEGAKYGRRVPAVLPLLASSLQKGVQFMEEEQELGQQDAEDESSGRLPGWQEVYACLLLLERLANTTATQVAWQKSEAVQQVWHAVVALLAYPHLWVRKAAGRLVGLLLSTAKLGAGLLSGEGTKPGQLALAVYCQLEADVDDTLAAQAIKCLVHLSKEMLQVDMAAGLTPTALASVNGECVVNDSNQLSNGHAAGLNENVSNQSEHRDEDGTAAADSEAESKGQDEQEQQELGLAGAPGLTLQGLVRRMAKMAGDRTFHRQVHRIWALKFIAALTTRLGPEGILRYLNQIMQPLYRIQESGSAPNTDETKQLAEEIISHIREVAGADALVLAFTCAKKAVTAVRSERKRRAAVQVLVDPEAAARTKLHKQERRAAGRKRKMEEMQRRRGAGVAVKNKKNHKGVDV